MADLGETLKASALGAICPIWKYSPLQAGLELAKVVAPLLSPTASVFTPINEAVSSYLNEACTPIVGAPNSPGTAYEATDSSGIEYADLTFTPFSQGMPIPARVFYGCGDDPIVSVQMSDIIDRGSASEFYSFRAVRRSGSEDSNNVVETIPGTPRPTFTYKSCGGGTVGPTGGGYPPITPGDGPKIQVFAPIIAGIAGVGIAGALQVDNVFNLSVGINANVNNLNVNLNALSIAIGAQGKAQKDCCAEILGRLAAIITQLTVIQTFEALIDDDVKSVLKVLGFGRDGTGPPYLGRGDTELLTLRDSLQDLAKRLGYDAKDTISSSFNTPLKTSTVSEEFEFLRSKMGFAGKYLLPEGGKPAIPDEKQPHSIEDVIKGIRLGEPDPIYETDKLLTTGLGNIVEITPDQFVREITVDVPKIGIYTFIPEFPEYLGREFLGETRFEFGSYRYTDNAPDTENSLVRSMGPRYPITYTRQFIPGGPEGTRVRFRVSQGVRLRFFLADLLENKPEP